MVRTRSQLLWFWTHHVSYSPCRHHHCPITSTYCYMSMTARRHCLFPPASHHHMHCCAVCADMDLFVILVDHSEGLSVKLMEIWLQLWWGWARVSKESLLAWARTCLITVIADDGPASDVKVIRNIQRWWRIRSRGHRWGFNERRWRQHRCQVVRITRGQGHMEEGSRFSGTISSR